MSFARAVTLTGPVAINTGAGAGNILFSGTVDGGQNLTLAAGTGNVTFDGAVGDTTRLGDLTINGATGGVTSNSTIDATSVTIANGGGVVIRGRITSPGGFSSAGTTFDNTGGPITTTNNAITINHAGAVTIGGALASNGGAVDIDATGAGATIGLNSGITSGAGDVTLDSAGRTTVAAAGDIVTTTGDVTFGGTRAGALTTSGDVTTAGGDVTFNRATVLGANVVVDTGAGAGNISYQSTLDGTVPDTQTLDLTAGTGNILFNGAVGSTVRLGALRIHSAGGITSNSTMAASSISITDGGAVDLNGAVTSPGGFSSAGTTFDNTGGPITTTGTGITINHTGNVIIGGALRSDGGAVDIDATGAGATIALNSGINSGAGNVTLDSVGTTTIAAAGDIVTSAGDVTFGGTLAGGLITAGDITTTSGNVTFNRATVLSGDVVVNTGTSSGNILFQNTLDGTVDYAQNLTLTAGSRSILFNGAVGSNAALGTLTINSAAGGVTSNSTLAANSISIIDGGAVDLNGAVTAPGGFSSAGTTFDNTGAPITTNGSAITIDHSGAVTIGGALISNGGAIDIDGASIGIAGGINAGTGRVSLYSVQNIEGPGTISGQSVDVNAYMIGMSVRPTFDVEGSQFMMTLRGTDGMGMSGFYNWTTGRALPPEGNISAPGAVTVGSYTYGIAEIEAATAAAATASSQLTLLENAVQAATQAEFFQGPPTLIGIGLEEEDELTTFLWGLPTLADEPGILLEEDRPQRINLVYLVQ
ncbi:MAG: hypothetical protein CVU57_09900 [Deltaproteobacteria bacterium HGW-Deltaproteobacteria-15]|nr:MAG: hypothetical protein CVU57_09900 [Deltaproteobacteria bacterium HGW-Deltaproteobacteria-15]